MGKTKLLIWMDHNEEVLGRLRKINGLEVKVLTGAQYKNYEAAGVSAPPEQARDTDILFCGLPFANMAAFETLKLIQISSTGYSQLFGLDLPLKGIRACNGRGEFDTPIGDWCLAMMVNLNRDVRGMIRNQEAGIWARPARHQTELRGKRVGFFGYGSIAREAARLAAAIGMEVVAYDRERADFSRRNYYVVPGTGDMKAEIPAEFYYPGEELAFCEKLDFFVAAMPLTTMTEGMINERILRALPAGAFVLNFARGPLIDEQSLLGALRDGHLGGAALDVHYHYPMPADHPLWRFPNVIMTPHISGSSLSPNYLPRIYDILTQNVKRYMAGEPLLNELSADQLNGA